MMGATTLEFFRTSMGVRVLCNLKKMSLEEWLTLEEAKTWVLKICKAILQKYPADCPCQQKFCMRGPLLNPSFQCDAPKVVGGFIKKYFLGHTRQFDVVISDESDAVQMNLENQL